MQVPGLTVAEDQTEILSRGYWPSYNVPFYPEIYRSYAQASQRSYAGVPCAKILRELLLAMLFEVRTVLHRRAGYLKLQRDQQARGADYVAAARQKSYQLAPRATIFRRDAGKVTDLESLKRVMRSNDYQNDPVRDSLCKFILAIVLVDVNRIDIKQVAIMCAHFSKFPVVAAQQHLLPHDAF